MNETTKIAPEAETGGEKQGTGQSEDGPSTVAQPTPERPSLFERLAGFFKHRNGSSLREDLADALAEGAPDDEAAFSPGERAMLKNILRLREVRVEDVMVPRADIEAIEIGTSLSELLVLFEQSGHSRMPVYAETLDDPRGMVHIRDAVAHVTRTAKEKKGRGKKASPVVLSLASVDLSKSVGELNLIRSVLFVPPSMLASDFRVNGKVVEFGLRLPDGRRLPIDSKWSAVAELEAMEAEEDPTRRDACARKVEKSVSARAKEVGQYIDTSVTAPVAVAAVPDAAYQVLSRAHTEAFMRGVVIVPYSSALPIIMFLYALVERFGDAADVQAALAEVGTLLDTMDAIVENKFSKAGTMIANGADEFRSSLGKARGSIARARHAEQLQLTDVEDEEVLSIVR